MTPHTPPTHLDLLIDALPLVLALVGLVAAWMGAWAWRRHWVQRQPRDWNHSRGEADPRP